jgi:hypothetical protein
MHDCQHSNFTNVSQEKTAVILTNFPNFVEQFGKFLTSQNWEEKRSWEPYSAVGRKITYKVNFSVFKNKTSGNPVHNAQVCYFNNVWFMFLIFFFLNYFFKQPMVPPPPQSVRIKGKLHSSFNICNNFPFLTKTSREIFVFFWTNFD